MSEKRRILWVGDAACDSGFARCTHKTLETLSKYWDVHVLGINHRGDPHPYPYPIYRPALGGDYLGYGRIKELDEKIRPDLIILQNDPWNIPGYTKYKGPRYVGVIAVDALNCRGDVLNDLELAIFWTKFGEEEAKKGGYKGESAVIGLGVDRKIYKPLFDKAMARRALGLPEYLENVFIVGNVNRNQPRKRLDLTIRFFANWVKRYGVDDAYLFLHVAPTGDQGYDCEQLAQYYGVDKRMILADPGAWKGVPEEKLALEYNIFDVQVSTTQGEGWGLTTLEGMACGIPQIVPDWSGLGEWTRGGAILIPCIDTAISPTFINTVGGIVAEQPFIEQLDRLYRSPKHREEWVDNALSHAARPEFDWENVGKQFALTLANTFYANGVSATT